MVSNRIRGPAGQSARHIEARANPLPPRGARWATLRTKGHREMAICPCGQLLSAAAEALTGRGHLLSLEGRSLALKRLDRGGASHEYDRKAGTRVDGHRLRER